MRLEMNMKLVSEYTWHLKGQQRDKNKEGEKTHYKRDI